METDGAIVAEASGFTGAAPGETDWCLSSPAKVDGTASKHMGVSENGAVYPKIVLLNGNIRIHHSILR